MDLDGCRALQGDMEKPGAEGVSSSSNSSPREPARQPLQLLLLPASSQPCSTLVPLQQPWGLLNNLLFLPRMGHLGHRRLGTFRRGERAAQSLSSQEVEALGKLLRIANFLSRGEKKKEGQTDKCAKRKESARNGDRIAPFQSNQMPFNSFPKSNNSHTLHSWLRIMGVHRCGRWQHVHLLLPPG